MEGDVGRWCGGGLSLVKLRRRTLLGDGAVIENVGDGAVGGAVERWCGEGKCGRIHAAYGGG